MSEKEFINELVSFIVPCYNVEEYVEECIRSLMNQTYSNIEIIAIDDGSTDNTSQIVKKLQEEDSRIIYQYKENGGLSSARNAGLDIANGKYISFVDSDDYLELNFVEKMMDVLHESNADLVCSSLLMKYDDASKTAKKAGPSEVIRYKKYQDFIRNIYTDIQYKICAVGGPAKLARIDLYKNFRFPIGLLCEDAWSIIDLVNECNNIVVLPDALYIYRQRETSIVHNKNVKLMLAELEWRIHHFEYWSTINEVELSNLVGHELLHLIRMYKKEIPDNKMNYYKKEYSKCWKYLMNNKGFALKYKIKYLTYAAPVFFNKF